MARGITLTQNYFHRFYSLGVNDSVDVILIKATRKYFPIVLFITLDNVLTFQSLEANRNM